MSASVALVHDDPEFVASAVPVLERAGFRVAVFADPMAALNQIESAQTFDTLITRADFPPGRSNGVSLALVLRTKFPALNVVFVARGQHEVHTAGIGAFIPHPVDLVKVVDAVRAGAGSPPL